MNIATVLQLGQEEVGNRASGAGSRSMEVLPEPVCKPTFFCFNIINCCRYCLMVVVVVVLRREMLHHNTAILAPSRNSDILPCCGLPEQ